MQMTTKSEDEIISGDEDLDNKAEHCMLHTADSSHNKSHSEPELCSNDESSENKDRFDDDANLVVPNVYITDAAFAPRNIGFYDSICGLKIGMNANPTLLDFLRLFFTCTVMQMILT